MAEPSHQPAAAPKSRRRWLQFSLRTMLVAVTALCVWLAVVTNRAERQRRTVSTLQKSGHTVWYDYQLDADGKFLKDAEPRGPAWLRNLIGVDYFSDVVGIGMNAFDRPVAEAEWQALTALPKIKSLLANENSKFDDAALAHVGAFTRLESLDLSGTKVTDAGLKSLRPLGRLKCLSLSDTRITDAGLQRLKQLDRLETLNLTDTPITDEGLAHLIGLTRLKELDLMMTHITDAGLEYLLEMPQLKKLNLGCSHATVKGRAKLHKELPSLKIIH